MMFKNTYLKIWKVLVHIYSACVCAKSLQVYQTLCDPMDYSPQAPSAHGILQVRILEWVAMSSSKGCSQPRDQTRLLHLLH